MTQSIADVLDAAADLIDKLGLAKEEWQNDLTGCLCAEGAIARAANLKLFAAASNSPAGRFFENFLAESYGVPRDIPAWNDAPERTQAEVVAALRQAASKAREVQS